MSTIITSTEVKKMKQGMTYSKKEKTIIMNVFKYFRSQYQDQNVTEIVRKTAKATGCSEKSIFAFRKEEVSPQGFKEPSKTRIRKNISTNNRLVKYNECVRESIRNIIYDLKSKNVVPSLSIILKHITSNNLPSFSIMTLRRLLYDMGFYYEKNGNKSVLMEKVVSVDRNMTVSNKSVLKKSTESAPPNTLQENLGSQFNSKTSIVKQDPSVSNLTNSVHGDVNQLKSDIQKYHCNADINIHQTHRIQSLASYQENQFTNLESTSHMPVMCAPRIPVYHMHSSVPYAYSSKMDVHLKRHEEHITHHPHIHSQNVIH